MNLNLISSFEDKSILLEKYGIGFDKNCFNNQVMEIVEKIDRF